MAFLQINNPDGTSGIKRPFRLVDLQDVWNGIKSLFRALSGQDFRIISGFDLENGVYTSGTVWYNGELYEYDKDTYPITPETTKVSFGSVPQDDDRVWQGGGTRPFAIRFICGGDTYSGATEFTDFVANIERYKSYLGDGSVTTSKLGHRSVTTDKLAVSALPPRTLQSGSLALTSQSVPLSQLLSTNQEEGLVVNRIRIDGSSPSSATVYLNTLVESNYPSMFVLEIKSFSPDSVELTFRHSRPEAVDSASQSTKITVPARPSQTDVNSVSFVYVVLAKVNPTTYVPVSVYTR